MDWIGLDNVGILPLSCLALLELESCQEGDRGQEGRLSLVLFRKGEDGRTVVSHKGFLGRGCVSGLSVLREKNSQGASFGGAMHAASFLNYTFIHIVSSIQKPESCFLLRLLGRKSYYKSHFPLSSLIIKADFARRTR